MYDYEVVIKENVRYPPHPSKPWLVGLNSHAVIFGKTGMGKSNYLKHILSQLENSDSNTVLLDPHGGLADFLLSSTKKTITFLSGSDYEGSKCRYSGINLLGTSNRTEEAQLIGDWIRQAFTGDESLSKGTWGPRLDLIFSTVLVEMIKRKKGLTLSEFTRLLPNGKMLISFFPKQEFSPTGNFLHLQNLNSKQWTDFVTSSLNKLLPLVENPYIRRMISADDSRSVNLDAAILSGRNAIIPELDLGRVGEMTVRAISVLILARIWNTLLRRGPTEQRTYLVIDEANLIPESILNIFLTQGRKYGITIILGFQSPSQLSKNFLESILSNVQSYVCFAMSESGADLLAKNIPGTINVRLLKNTLKDLPRHKMVLSSETIIPHVGKSERYGPVTYSPKLVPERYSKDEINKVKASIIRTIGFEEKEGPGKLSEDWTSHNRMMYLFSEFLESKSVKTSVEPNIGGLIPDILIEHKGRKIICEVEDSDILVTHRIAKKLKDYKDLPLIFLCRREDFTSLIKLLANILQSAMRRETYYHKNEKIPSTDLINTFSHLSIATFHENEFFFYNGSSMTKFSASHLERESSFIYRARKLPLGHLRESILRQYTEMLSSSGELDLDKIEDRYGRERIRELYGSMKESGYEDIRNIVALLEIDRVEDNLVM